MKRALLAGLAGLAALVVAGGVVGAVALGDPGRGSAAGPAVVRDARPAVAQAEPGWNSAGGSFAAQPVVPPSSVPEGGGTGRADGEAARAAGDADYVGFRPTRLRLPSGRQAPVAAAGVRTDGTLAVPDNPNRLGLWTGGALPGERYGSVVIAGHVDAVGFGTGPLAEMSEARVGQVLKVSGAAGRAQEYRISSVQQIVKARLSADSPAFAQDDDARLVLITCGGPFDRATHHYRDNIVVTALPI